MVFVAANLLPDTYLVQRSVHLLLVVIPGASKRPRSGVGVYLPTPTESSRGCSVLAPGGATVKRDHCPTGDGRSNGGPIVLRRELILVVV